MSSNVHSSVYSNTAHSGSLCLQYETGWCDAKYISWPTPSVSRAKANTLANNTRACNMIHWFNIHWTFVWKRAFFATTIVTTPFNANVQNNNEKRNENSLTSLYWKNNSVSMVRRKQRDTNVMKCQRYTAFTKVSVPQRLYIILISSIKYHRKHF